MSANISSPIYDVWLHIEPYYKFNTYTRIAGYIWENGCDWLAGKRSFLLDYFGHKLMKYLSVNHTCSYSDYVFIKTDNVSAQEFTFPQIVPAGRYFMDIYITEGDRSKILGNIKM